MPGKFRGLLLASALAFGLFSFTVAIKQPHHTRKWQTHLSRLPIVQLDEGVFSITQYRDWTYASDAPKEQRWRESASFELANVRQAWFVVEPHPGLPVMAHTLVLFEFRDGDMIGLTVEARKERHESYSAVRGVLNAFELIYQWATPKDLLTRRAVMMEKELYLYRLDLTQAETEAYLRAVLEKTQAIEAKPRFYNTAVSNCTNELAKSAGLDWHPAFVLTGTADEALFDMGRIKGDGDFAAVRTAARIDPLVREKAHLPRMAFHRELVSGR